MRSPLVGLLGLPYGTAAFAEAANRLSQHGAVAYAATALPPRGRSPPRRAAHASLPSQGGRWFHVLPLLRTGVRVLVSDADVVWLRDPRPYLAALESAHPLMDFAVSTDSQWHTDGRRLPPAWGSGSAVELDLETASACHASMNIGILSFAPGRRPGALRAVAEMVAHLSLPGNLRRVDQGPINYRWARRHRLGRAYCCATRRCGEKLRRHRLHPLHLRRYRLHPLHLRRYRLHPLHM